MRMELTLSALERLLGGDTEIEAGMRQQIADEFCKKNLKALLNDETYKRISEQWRTEIKQAVADKMNELIQGRQNQIDDGRTERGIWDFTTPVERAAQKAVDEAVLKIVEYQKRYFSREIQQAVEKALNNEIEIRIKEGIQSRLTVAKNLNSNS